MNAILIFLAGVGVGVIGAMISLTLIAYLTIDSKEYHPPSYDEDYFLEETE